MNKESSLWNRKKCVVQSLRKFWMSAGKLQEDFTMQLE
jgi:hypothetical protein